MIDNGTKGYKTLEDIGGERDLAEFCNDLWWCRVAPWRTYGMKKMPWWYYQARNSRIRKCQSAYFGPSRLRLKSNPPLREL